MEEQGRATQVPSLLSTFFSGKSFHEIINKERGLKGAGEFKGTLASRGL